MSPLQKPGESKITNFAVRQCWTHLPILSTVVMRASHLVGTLKVLELGTGFFSTPTLHALCSQRVSTLVSVETETKWYVSAVAEFQSDKHRIELVDGYNDDTYNTILKSEQWWDVCLVDQLPAESRGPSITALRDYVNIFVCHDASGNAQMKTYGYDKVYKTFKYRTWYTGAGRPYTMLLSDTVNVEEVFREAGCTPNLVK